MKRQVPVLMITFQIPVHADVIGLEVPIPRTHICRGQGKAELFLMSAEGLFHARAFGNVAGNAAGCAGSPGSGPASHSRGTDDEYRRG